MDYRALSFAAEMTKLAEEDSKKKQSYPAAMVAMAPFALAKGVADVPKGALDKNIEQLITGTPKKKRQSGLRRGLGRGVGSIGGGLVTTPLFFSGIKDIKESKDKEQKR